MQGIRAAMTAARVLFSCCSRRPGWPGWPRSPRQHLGSGHL